MFIKECFSQYVLFLEKRRYISWLAVCGFVLIMATGCSKPTANNSSVTPPPPPSTSAKNATITAEPNPIQVCDGSGTGVTKLTWTSVGPAVVEMHVNSPNGDLLARTGANGMATTAKWVTDGMTFYLQDVTGGKTLTPENTLATFTAKITKAGCP